MVQFEQAAALGELSVRWTGTDEGEVEIADEYDEARRDDETVADAVTDDDVRNLAARMPQPSTAPSPELGGSPRWPTASATTQPGGAP